MRWFGGSVWGGGDGVGELVGGFVYGAREGGVEYALQVQIVPRKWRSYYCSARTRASYESNDVCRDGWRAAGAGEVEDACVFHGGEAEDLGGHVCLVLVRKGGR